jgi:hypothetical protein
VAQPGRPGPEALRISPSELGHMAAAADMIRSCRSRGVLRDIAAEEAVAEWRRYPEGEVYDPRTHVQYFFHAHPAGERAPREHGHFHLFMRAEGMPAGITPLLLPEIAVADAPIRPPQAAPLKRGSRDEVSHIVAIAVDDQGEPIRLFTTNRWVTGETWYPAKDVIGMLDRFHIEDGTPPVAANRWLAALLGLYRPQIAALLRSRDEAVMAWRRRRRTHVFEDPRLEITSSLEVELDAQLAFVDAARARSSADPRPGLPRMAEGWGEDGPV